MKLSSFLKVALAATLWSTASAEPAAVSDPCAVLAGKEWVNPAEARACFTSYKVDPIVKKNMIEVINKTLPFHVSASYQIQVEGVYANDVHSDVVVAIANISSTQYASEFDMHLDLSAAFKAVNDGHFGWSNFCYDGVYISYLPTPLVLLSGADGKQNVHIDPQAFELMSAEFPDAMDFWQDALPGPLKGKLQSLNGALVLRIDGEDPFVAVNANAAISGKYQALAARQNGFFSSYHLTNEGWTYVKGEFAEKVLPLRDNVTLTVQRTGQSHAEAITIPYYSLFNRNVFFNDTSSWRTAYCTSVDGFTNGVDLYAPTAGNTSSLDNASSKSRPEIINEIQPSHIVRRANPRIASRAEGTSNNETLPTVVYYSMLDDGNTGVLAIGSFQDQTMDTAQFATLLLNGLLNLTESGATQLIVDVTNNGGGTALLGDWLHRIISGPKETTEPQPGLDTKFRVNRLGELMVEKIINNQLDPDVQLVFNPEFWADAHHKPFGPKDNWLQPVQELKINGRLDYFSPRLGNASPFDLITDWPIPPAKPLFDGKKVVVVGNGRCASTCATFSIVMAKKEGSKTIVIGGKDDIPQHYTGTVGGQTLNFAQLDSAIQTTGLKNHTLAPPVLTSRCDLRLTLRLSYAVDQLGEPEEWQDHTATANLPLTVETVNNPLAIWKEVARTAF